MSGCVPRIVYRVKPLFRPKAAKWSSGMHCGRQREAIEHEDSLEENLSGRLTVAPVAQIEVEEY